MITTQKERSVRSMAILTEVCCKLNTINAHPPAPIVLQNAINLIETI